ncbi:43kDa postsynaptic protein [Trema orientale]|uniref:43kDa postsynaptic protein n=1 Tax=Trema orientale TaxID=63057 RepID=A0A2P5EDR4_TREOI|nr:43kDa postsynaptic protein [Trema orientale]
MMIISHILLLHSTPSDQDRDHDHDHHDNREPFSPSMVFVPVLFLAESIKRQIPVMSYSMFLQRSSGSNTKRQEGADDHHEKVAINDKDDQGRECVVCMNPIEPEDEVRVPITCRHVYHRECLDSWVDQGQSTCPLCRSKLVATSHNHDDQGDPLRMERMFYLLGDDYFLG